MAENVIRVDRTRLDAMMELRNLTVQELAERLNMHPNGVFKIRRQQSTSLATLNKICKALDCHPFDLIVAEGYPEPFSVAPESH